MAPRDIPLAAARYWLVALGSIALTLWVASAVGYCSRDGVSPILVRVYNVGPRELESVAIFFRERELEIGRVAPLHGSAVALPGIHGEGSVCLLFEIDGVRRDVIIEQYVMRDTHGGIEALVGVGTDVTVNSITTNLPNGRAPIERVRAARSLPRDTRVAPCDGL